MGGMLYDSTPHATHGNGANQTGSFYLDESLRVRSGISFP